MKLMNKRIISLLLALVMLCGMMPMTAFAAEGTDATCDHTYENGICTSCGAKNPYVICLRYDDRYDISGKTVEVNDGETVVAIENDALRAVAIGKTTIQIDDILYDVIVEKAKINIVVIMGQSNAGNHFANATSDVTCPLGTAYWWKNGATAPVDYTEPSMGFHTPLLAELYAQSVAADDPVKNVMVWQEGVTSKNGQSIVKWAASETDTSGTDGTAMMIKNCITYYEKNSDLYEIENCGVYWLQGESDITMSPEKYTELFMAMWGKLKAAGAKYLAFFRLRWGTVGNTSEHYDLGYTGSLTAQLQMINNNTDMFMASTITENWEGNETTEHSIDIRNYITLMEEYGKDGELNDSYGNAATFKNGILTTTMKTLYGSNNKCHYGKFGYGIIGADAAYNMYQALRNDEFAIIQTNTSGKADAKLISKPGNTVPIDITEMTENLAFRASCGSIAGTLDIQVLSGNEDITERVIARGMNTFGTVDTEILREYENVTITVTYSLVEGNSGNVVYTIVDNRPKPPKMYIWDFENDLNARDEKGEIVNSFGEALIGSYVLENGRFKATGLHLELEKLIQLSGEKNWSIEWKFGEVTDNSQGFIFSSRNKNEIGNKAFYHVKYGQFMISEYVDSKGYRNYTLERVKVKTGDIIKITNQYDAQTGRSTMSLWQNGTIVIEDFQQKGSINGCTSDLDMTGYPLSGDFTLNYMGSGTFATVTEEFEYIKIILDEKDSTVDHTHRYSTSVTAPTCTEQGYTTYTCTLCGDSYVDDHVDATGHRYSSQVSEPTCTQPGFTLYVCSGCSDFYAESIPATGHTYVDGICTGCGDVLLGDLNYDAIVDLLDLSEFAVALANSELPEASVADINGDGIVDLLDYSDLAVSLAG